MFLVPKNPMFFGPFCWIAMSSCRYSISDGGLGATSSTCGAFPVPLTMDSAEDGRSSGPSPARQTGENSLLFPGRRDGSPTPAMRPALDPGSRATCCPPTVTPTPRAAWTALGDGLRVPQDRAATSSNRRVLKPPTILPNVAVSPICLLAPRPARPRLPPPPSFKAPMLLRCPPPVAEKKYSPENQKTRKEPEIIFILAS